MFFFFFLWSNRKSETGIRYRYTKSKNKNRQYYPLLTDLNGRLETKVYEMALCYPQSLCYKFYVFQYQKHEGFGSTLQRMRITISSQVLCLQTQLRAFAGFVGASIWIFSVLEDNLPYSSLKLA